jgi:hypothetical protein
VIEQVFTNPFIFVGGLLIIIGVIGGVIQEVRGK